MKSHALSFVRREVILFSDRNIENRIFHFRAVYNAVSLSAYLGGSTIEFEGFTV